MPSGSGSPEATPSVNTPRDKFCAQAGRGAAANVADAAASRVRRVVSITLA